MGLFTCLRIPSSTSASGPLASFAVQVPAAAAAMSPATGLFTCLCIPSSPYLYGFPELLSRLQSFMPLCRCLLQQQP
jgi:hypothetical protein